jgi:Ca2+-binding RTX toxin-like protein
VRGFSLQDTAHGIETFEGFGAPTKYFGSADADHFIGTSYNDWFLPLGGDDVIDGGPTFDGSELGDTDVFSVAASSQPETFDMDARTATGEGTDSYADVEVLSGSPQADTFVGNAARARLIGIDGGGGDDVLDFGSVLAPQTVYLGPSMPPGPLWVTGIEKVIGSNGGDVFVFTSGDVAARFLGRHGDDTLIGGHLDDVLLGGKGDDTINGKRGVDTCRGGGGQDTISNCERS